MDEIVRLCFGLGFTQREMLHVIRESTGIILSDRQLRRVLRQNYLYRSKHQSDIVDVAQFINENINGSGCNLGYRLMHFKCKLAGYVISRNNVRLIQGILDHEGVERRRRRRLVRRRYFSRGPNHVWHFDSYDKLTPYGIPINGCIDGFSRSIIWLEANHTASDPKVVGGYFVQSIEKHGGIPMYMRADKGTENTVVCDIFTVAQELITGSRDEASKRFIYGKSTGNQRIERWWSFLRRSHMDFWIQFFHNIKEDGNFSGSKIDKDLIRFVFLDMIQEELDDIVLIWNLHRIRSNRYYHHAVGKPSLMYSSPEIADVHDHIQPLSEVFMRSFREECIFKTRETYCDEDISEFCNQTMNRHRLEKATDPDSGLNMYMFLRQEINQIL